MMEKSVGLLFAITDYIDRRAVEMRNFLPDKKNRSKHCTYGTYRIAYKLAEVRMNTPIYDRIGMMRLQYYRDWFYEASLINNLNLKRAAYNRILNELNEYIKLA